MSRRKRCNAQYTLVSSIHTYIFLNTMNEDHEFCYSPEECELPVNAGVCVFTDRVDRRRSANGAL